MGVEGIMLSEISQKEKDKYYMISLIFEIFKKKKTQNKTPKTELRYKEQTGGYQTHFQL